MKGFLAIMALVSVTVTDHTANAWPLSDPNKYETGVPFTLKWAKSLRGFHTLADLQRAAGSAGTISERNLRGADPTINFHWRSQPSNFEGVGYMLATIRPNGRIAVSISTLDEIEITLNNEGAFVCDKCQPPIDMQ